MLSMRRTVHANDTFPRLFILWIMGNSRSSTLARPQPSSELKKLLCRDVSLPIVCHAMVMAYSRRASRSGSPHLNGSLDSSTVGW